MKALLFEPGKAPEIVEAESFEDLLGGEIETLWPFEDLDVCLVLLNDREELEVNRVLFGRTIRGPFFVAGFTDDYEDISEQGAEIVEPFFSYAEGEDMDDPCEEVFGHIRIVDEETFYRELKEEII